MEQDHLTDYLHEIDLQIDAFEDRIRSADARLSQGEVARSFQSMFHAIVHSAITGKILFGSKQTMGKPEERKAAELFAQLRSKALKETLRYDDDSFLAIQSTGVRNAFEHLDHRLDLGVREMEWTGGPKHDFFVGQRSEGSAYRRDFDPETGDLKFYDVSINLRTLRDEMVELFIRLRSASYLLGSLNWDYGLSALTREFIRIEMRLDFFMIQVGKHGTRDQLHNVYRICFNILNNYLRGDLKVAFSQTNLVELWQETRFLENVPKWLFDKDRLKYNIVVVERQVRCVEAFGHCVWTREPSLHEGDERLNVPVAFAVVTRENFFPVLSEAQKSRDTHRRDNSIYEPGKEPSFDEAWRSELQPFSATTSPGESFVVRGDSLIIR